MLYLSFRAPLVMAAAWPAGTPCEFLYADGKWYRAISSGIVADLPLATSRGLVG